MKIKHASAESGFYRSTIVLTLQHESDQLTNRLTVQAFRESERLKHNESIRSISDIFFTFRIAWFRESVQNKAAERDAAQIERRKTQGCQIIVHELDAFPVPFNQHGRPKAEILDHIQMF